MTAAARNAIFVATVTPAQVDRLQGAKGPYTRLRGATVSMRARGDIVRTVMAFGAPNDQVSAMLSPGVPLRLVVAFDGPTIRVVGLPREAAETTSADEASDAPRGASEDDRALSAALDLVSTSPYADVVRVEVGAILSDAGVHDDLASGIVETMLSGGADFADDAELSFSADVIEDYGHLLAPLVDAGVDHADALGVVASISAIPSGSYLADMRTLRRQIAVRGLLDS